MPRASFNLRRHVRSTVRLPLLFTSLIVSIAATSVAVRSFWKTDVWQISLVSPQRQGGNVREIEIEISHGVVGLEWSRQTFATTDDFTQAVAGFGEGSKVVSHIGEDIGSNLAVALQVARSRIGFAYSSSTSFMQIPTHEAVVPLWPVALLTLPTFFMITRRMRSTRRAARGHCLQCGYDLRETAARCPECGAAPASPDSSKSSWVAPGMLAAMILAITGTAITLATVWCEQQQRQILDRYVATAALSDAVLDKDPTYERQHMRQLFSRGADPSAMGGAAMRNAIEVHSKEAISELLDHGADMNRQGSALDGSSALEYATWLDMTEVVSWLLEADANPRAIHSDPAVVSRALLAANSVKLVHLLLEHHPDVSFRGESGATALLRAMSDGRVDIARVLLDAGADPNQRNFDDDKQAFLTPLLMLTDFVQTRAFPQSDRCELARLLIAHHADINAPDRLGQTPLHRAVRARLYDLTRLLVNAGADLNALDQQGHRPIDLLKDDEAGADLSARDDTGRRPIELRDAYTDEIRQMLTPKWLQRSQFGR